MEPGNTTLLPRSHCCGGHNGTEHPRSPGWGHSGGIPAHAATGADVTVNYSIPHPPPPQKRYLEEGKKYLLLREELERTQGLLQHLQNPQKLGQ